MKTSIFNMTFTLPPLVEMHEVDMKISIFPTVSVCGTFQENT